MNTTRQFDAMFSGVIGQEYEMLKLICPFAPEMCRLVGLEVSAAWQGRFGAQAVVELGGGTGMTTLSILTASEHAEVLSIDNEPAMQDQAKQNLHDWIKGGRLRFSGDDALMALQKLDANSVDTVASAYTLHNLEASYRKRVIEECYRVLKTGGRFINGDRYALDDVTQHTRNTQQEVAGYFKVLTEINRLDLLEQWIIHLFSDESENHIMRESLALQQLKDAGFEQIQLKLRKEINALVTAVKA